MTAQQLVSIPGDLYCQFGPDDQGLDYDWRVAAGRECRTFHGPKELKWVAISPNGRLMASACADGVRLWDVRASREGDRELATLPVGLAARAHFDPKGESLITDGSAGLQRWPIAPDPETDGLRIGPPQSVGLSARAPLILPGYDADVALSADGRTVAHCPLTGQALLFDPFNPQRKLHIEAPRLRHASFSPDGKWLATGNWRGRGAKVWDAQTGGLVHKFDLGESDDGAAWPAFSPDGKWLVIGTFAEYRFYEVGSWENKRTLPRATAGRGKGLSVFSPDGKMVALLHGVSGVRLVDPETGREFGRLPAGCPYCFSPDGSQLVTNAEQDGDFQVWDLRLIRSELAELGLDWDLPPYPPAVSDNGKPLQVKVLPAEPLSPSAELDAQAYLDRGVVYLQLRHYPNAWADFTRAGILDPKQHPLEEVIRSYSQQIERDPLRLDLLAHRGMLYLGTGQMDKAADDFRKASKRTPALANNFAWVLARSPELAQRDPSLAVELAKRATEQAPRNGDYWNTLAVAHYRAGKWASAMQALEESQRLEPDRNLGFNDFVMAMCHHQLGDPLQAKACYDRAVRWCDEQQATRSARQQEDLKALRAEAEALLRMPMR
jgi:WD40 repeat protein/tetratricopeptide (TPR) repeat protein